ncbi:hypothetical protein ABIA33_001334 [Streptacidiphilus sp. MAP12-16]|uniref:hypothetical protein n=1 Tax=Streptacidiphilus sp. MAP12-16 TaxID=3156300 RepID=UPI00351599AC
MAAVDNARNFVRKGVVAVVAAAIGVGLAIAATSAADRPATTHQADVGWNSATQPQA